MQNFKVGDEVEICKGFRDSTFYSRSGFFGLRFKVKEVQELLSSPKRNNLIGIITFAPKKLLENPDACCYGVVGNNICIEEECLRLTTPKEPLTYKRALEIMGIQK